MKMTRIKHWLGLGCLASVLACSDDAHWLDSAAQLQVSVSISDGVLTKGLVEGSSFGSAEEIGLYLEGMSAAAYDGTNYQNVCFTSDGVGEGQSWSGGPILLSSTKGKTFCYWPYDSNGFLDYTAVPIDAADQIDYLYSGWTNEVSNANAALRVNMKHALTAIQFNVSRGDYTGTAQLTAVAISSDGLGATGNLDLSTGAVSSQATGSIALSGLDAALRSDVAYEAKLLALPMGLSEAKPIQATFTIDGKDFPIELSVSEPCAAGSKYVYDITLNGLGLSVSLVKVTKWSDSGVNQDIDTHL